MLWYLVQKLLLNASMSYFAEYFSTFFLRHDIWKERNKSVKVHSLLDTSSMNAADEEEKLLSEEYQQNFTIVSLLCLLMLYFSVQILVSWWRSKRARTSICWSSSFRYVLCSYIYIAAHLRHFSFIQCLPLIDSKLLIVPVKIDRQQSVSHTDSH